MIIKCMVAAHDANGAPDLFFTKVKISSEGYKQGLHYGVATTCASKAGYAPPMIAFDENDPGMRLCILMSGAWDNIP